MFQFILSSILIFILFQPVQANFNQFHKETKNIKGLDQMGVFIADENGQIIFSHNQDKLLIPASVTKVVTGLAILELMGPAKRIITRLESNAKIENQNLKGDLYLVGGGDPSFVSENMWVLVNHFVRNGIKKIEGSLVVDDTLFDSVRFDQSRLSTRVDRAYDAPVGAMSFNWNSVNIYTRPGKKLGEPALVYADPESEYIILDSKVVTTQKETNLQIDRVNNKGKDKIIVRGQINIKQKEKVNYVSISEPDLWSGYQLKSFLEQRGIQVMGQVKRGQSPESASVLAESESRTLSTMVTDMNKFSNNYVAEMLVKLLGAQKNKMASLQDGNNLIKKYLIDNQMGPEKMVFNNPSGLTRTNFFTAKSTWELLAKAHRDLRYGGEFLTSLPIAGVDGTLKSRLKNETTQGKIRAKTGYINGVVSLAGYLSHHKMGIVPFAIFYNGNLPEAQVRESMDKLLNQVVTIQ